ncbi:alpha/beta fold hydrolase [Nocardia sp. NPDC058519]|uniref:alpha/beta fold hydrolase n=1 Tax=Nocardia sp. NPDC058519 TaxID=3346535 RepID=UPI003653A29C
MSTFMLIPGAGCDAGYWGQVADELRGLGHDAIPVSLPSEDDSAGLGEYADAVVEAIGERRDVVVVAHSFGGFTAPLVCERVPVERMVLVSAMIPAPGEAPGDWWANTGHATSGDDDVFYNQLTPAQRAEAEKYECGQSETPMESACPLASWPEVPTRFILLRDDRFFPADFMRGLVASRLGIEPVEMDGGHMVMMSGPAELARLLL